jgi:hypothetical protein
MRRASSGLFYFQHAVGAPDIGASRLIRANAGQNL